MSKILTEVFQAKNISRTKAYLLADAGELDLLFGENDWVSATELSTLCQSAVRTPDENLDIDETDVDDDNEPDSDSATTNSRIDSYVEDAIIQYEYRAKVFGQYYPFELDEDSVLRINKNINKAKLTYIFLLMCSQTSWFREKSGTPLNLADAFEILCKTALECLFPSPSQVYMFGPRSEDRKNIFGNKISDAIQVLASKMGATLDQKWQQKFNRRHKTGGDFKIDLVAICDFAKDTSSNFVAIAQCVASSDEGYWSKKKIEACMNFQSTLQFSHDPYPVLFIPVLYRYASGEWFDSNCISGVLVLDRLRIINLLDSSGGTFPAQKFMKSTAPEAFKKATFSQGLNE